MSLKKNINFEIYIPDNTFQNFNDINKKKIEKLIKKAKENIKDEKSMFSSFSKDFKMNFNFAELKRYKKFKRIIIIGLGGSILGTQATNCFLKKQIKKEMIFVNNLEINQINKLNKTRNLKNSLFIIISKSGNTVEVLSVINSLKKKAGFNHKNSIIITEKKENHLSSFAKELKIKIIYHRKYVGGRYSIFSETALVPCFLMGINITKLKKNILSFLYKKKSILINNLINLSKIYNSKKINSLVLLNYSQELEYFMLWCQQLIAESLGKRGKGKVPLISVGPRDHHSLLQLYLDGPKDNFFYVFSLKKNEKIKKNKGLFTSVLNNTSISNLLENQKKAVISLFKIKKIPFLSIEIKKRNEETLGELFSYFVLETVFLAENLKINPFNQPAVEQLKIITKKNLFKKIRK